MGARGPQPQPDNIRQLRGNPGRHKTKPHPQAVPAIPKPPSIVKGEALAEWKRVTPELFHLGILANLDRATLASYCIWWARWVEIHKLLTEDGLTHKDTTVSKRKSPLWQPYRDAQDQATKLAKEIGLTPVARLRMRTPDQDASDDGDLD